MILAKQEIKEMGYKRLPRKQKKQYKSYLNSFYIFEGFFDIYKAVVSSAWDGSVK